MEHYAEQQIAEFKEIFGIYDDCGDGKIPSRKLGECIRAFGQNPTESSIKNYTRLLEPEYRISFQTYLIIYLEISKLTASYTAEELIKGLWHLDTKHNGYVLSTDLRHLLTTVGDEEKLTNEEVNEILATTNDQDGNINYEEFVKMLING